MPTVKVKTKTRKRAAQPRTDKHHWTRKFSDRPSVWSPYVEGVTQSMLKAWRSCPETARLAYVEGFSPIATTMALEFGTCFHWCLGEIYKKPSLRYNKLRELYKDYEKVWFGERPSRMVTKKDRELLEQVIGLVATVLPIYLEVWEGDFKPNARVKDIVSPDAWVGLEQHFKVPFEIDGVAIPLQGKWDGVFKDSKGDLWLFETKTKAYIDDDLIGETLQYDLQVMLYLTAVELHFSKFPKGVVYNVVRRPGHRQSKTESLADFHFRVQKDVADPSRWDHYFKRWQMRISTKELVAWQETVLRPLLRALKHWWDTGENHWLNDDALVTKYGRSNYYDLLVHQTNTGFYRRKVAFNELEDFQS